MTWTRIRNWIAKGLFIFGTALMAVGGIGMIINQIVWTMGLYRTDYWFDSTAGKIHILCISAVFGGAILALVGIVSED